MANPNQMQKVLLFVCSKMADETNLSSIADRTRGLRKKALLVMGGGWVRQRCRVSCITGASICYLLTVGQGLLSLQQVRVEGEYFYFFCFFIFIHFPLSPIPFFHLYFISLLPFSGRPHKMTHKG